VLERDPGAAARDRVAAGDAVPSEQADVLHPLRILLKETQYELAGRMRTRAYSPSVIGFPVMFYLLFGTANRE